MLGIKHLYFLNFENVLFKIVYVENSSKFTGKKTASNYLFKNVWKPPAWHFIKRLWRSCFLQTFAIFLGSPFWLNYFSWRLLNVSFNMEILHPFKEIFSFPRETLKSKHYFNVVPTGLSFLSNWYVTTSSLEISKVAIKS